MRIEMKEATGAKTRTVELTQVDNVNFKVRTESGFDIYTDEAVENRGGGTAPRPLEALTAALAACQSVQIVRVAEAMRFTMRDLDVVCSTTTARLPGIDGNDPVMRFGAATMEVSFATDEPETRIDRLKALAVDRCPVSQLFQDAGIDVEMTWAVTPLEA
ncbi:MAG: OsmC family protein [Alphaproteobacteria bacterium]|nr:OsmC family protein [Alphaproteobacteria bacterium]